MTELLFKLKKDGKCVGYLQFTKYSDNDLHIQVSFDGFNWSDDTDDTIEYNSVHPYVRDDKHGKKVFADDKIKGHEECGIGHYDEIVGEVYLDEKTTFYRVSKVQRIPIYQVCCIELIEEAE